MVEMISGMDWKTIALIAALTGGSNVATNVGQYLGFVAPEVQRVEMEQDTIHSVARDCLTREAKLLQELANCQKRCSR